MQLQLHVFSETQCTIPTSLLLCETLLLPLFLYYLVSPSHMWNEHMYKHDSFWCDGGSCYSVELNGYIIEQSHSKGQITMRRFHLKGLCQSQNCFWDWQRWVRSKYITAKPPKLIPKLRTRNSYSIAQWPLLGISLQRRSVSLPC